MKIVDKIKTMDVNELSEFLDKYFIVNFGACGYCPRTMYSHIPNCSGCEYVGQFKQTALQMINKWLESNYGDTTNGMKPYRDSIIYVDNI